MYRFPQYFNEEDVELVSSPISTDLIPELFDFLQNHLNEEALDGLNKLQQKIIPDTRLKICMFWDGLHERGDGNQMAIDVVYHSTDMKAGCISYVDPQAMNKIIQKLTDCDISFVSKESSKLDVIRALVYHLEKAFTVRNDANLL